MKVTEWDATFAMLLMFFLYILFFAVNFYVECRCPEGLDTIIINGTCICVNMSFMEGGVVFEEV